MTSRMHNLRLGLAALLAAAALAPLAASAQDLNVSETIIVGAIKSDSDAAPAADTDAAPALPIVYEDAAPAQPSDDDASVTRADLGQSVEAQ